MFQKLQILRLFSLAGALAVGFWLPIRILDFELPIIVDVFFDLLVSVVSVVNIYLYFAESEKDFKNFKHWLSFSILLDLTCLIPFSLFEFALYQTENQMLLLGNLLAARHILRIKSFLNEFANLQPVVYRLVPIAFTMPLLVHLIACGWIALGSGTAGPDSDKSMEYIRAIYWTFTTLTTVGYGDISAKTAAQMLFASLIQVTGVGIFGFVLSNVASLLSRLDAAREHHMDNLDKIETFMKSHKIPTELKSKVRSYYHYLWKNHKGYSDTSLVQDLPGKMQSELYLFINRSIIEKVSILKGASPEFIEDLMQELKPKIFVPGERIFKIGEAGIAMYFIHNGHIDILDKNNNLVAELHDGAFFGEMALISDRPRAATALSKTYCDTYMLSKESFSHVMDLYPEFRANIDKVMKERTKAA